MPAWGPSAGSPAPYPSGRFMKGFVMSKMVLPLPLMAGAIASSSGHVFSYTVDKTIRSAFEASAFVPAVSFHSEASTGGTQYPPCPALAPSTSRVYPLPSFSSPTMARALSFVLEHMHTSYPALAQAAQRWTPMRPVPPRTAMVGNWPGSRSAGFGAHGPVGVESEPVAAMVVSIPHQDISKTKNGRSEGFCFVARNSASFLSRARGRTTIIVQPL
mmetsp:Transcript_6911/g.14021  ORF Transcript_6911/g.14021 Transcript_6911/m.14021 type:complete len:216 (-) Transcript_6911:5-652(-)